MKILQISDLHIDSKMETNFSLAQSKQRNNEILVTFENLFDVLEKEKTDLIDKYESKKMKLTSN